ncbi:MAG: dihydroneopterin aldolase [Proteobacteria bacterium]|nr:dihydroneopterin aldolase [Pseudomonadota bacterium]
MDTVFVRDLRVRALVGIFEWERRIRQELRIDLEMDFDIRKAAGSDRIEDALDYKAVSQRVKAHIEASSFQLVEALAESIATLVLKEFPVAGVKLTLNKTGAVRDARDVGVIIERKRQ